MLRMNLTSAKPGMVLAETIYHPSRPDTVLLKAGVTLDEHAIDRLRDQRLRGLYIRYPGLEALREYVNPEIDLARAQIAGRVDHAFAAIVNNSHADLDYIPFKDSVGSLIDVLLRSPQSALFLREMVASDHDDLEHACNVCVHSVLIGLKLEDYLITQRPRLRATHARDVVGLGVGAMLHDAGMLRLESEVACAWRGREDESDPEGRKHVLVGYELLRGHVSPSALSVVLHHHQRYDGTGFPGRVGPGGDAVRPAGSAIHIFARIAAAANIFDRYRHRSGKTVPIVRALRRMRDESVCSQLDPIVFKGLLAVTPPFPPGTLVTLDLGDGTRRGGVVTGWSPLEPCRPTVQLIDELEPEWSSPDPVRLDLRVQRGVRVVGVDGEDVSQDLFDPITPDEFDLTRAMRLLVNRAVEDEYDIHAA